MGNRDASKFVILAYVLEVEQHCILHSFLIAALLQPCTGCVRDKAPTL